VWHTAVHADILAARCRLDRELVGPLVPVEDVPVTARRCTHAGCQVLRGPDSAPLVAAPVESYNPGPPVWHVSVHPDLRAARCDIGLVLVGELAPLAQVPAGARRCEHPACRRAWRTLPFPPQEPR